MKKRQVHYAPGKSILVYLSFKLKIDNILSIKRIFDLNNNNNNKFGNSRTL